MPTTVTFRRKSNNEFISFQQMDIEICAHFDVPCDTERYICGWYNSIGDRLAYGNSFDRIRKDFEEGLARDQAKMDPEKKTGSVYAALLLILGFIEENYVCSVGHMPKF